MKDETGQGDWLWESEGQYLPKEAEEGRHYLNWAPGQQDTTPGENERCGHLMNNNNNNNVEGATWSRADCNMSIEAVCQIQVGGYIGTISKNMVVFN